MADQRQGVNVTIDGLPFKPANRELYDTIAKSHPSLMRDRVWCTRCGSYRDVDAAECLRTGWPKCCSATMSIDQPKEKANG